MHTYEKKNKSFENFLRGWGEEDGGGRIGASRKWEGDEGVGGGERKGKKSAETFRNKNSVSSFLWQNQSKKKKEREMKYSPGPGDSKKKLKWIFFFLLSLSLKAGKTIENLMFSSHCLAYTNIYILSTQFTAD